MRSPRLGFARSAGVAACEDTRGVPLQQQQGRFYPPSQHERLQRGPARGAEKGWHVGAASECGK